MVGMEVKAGPSVEMAVQLESLVRKNGVQLEDVGQLSGFWVENAENKTEEQLQQIMAKQENRLQNLKNAYDRMIRQQDEEEFQKQLNIKEEKEQEEYRRRQMLRIPRVLREIVAPSIRQILKGVMKSIDEEEAQKKRDYENAGALIVEQRNITFNNDEYINSQALKKAADDMINAAMDDLLGQAADTAATLQKQALKTTCNIFSKAINLVPEAQ